MDGVAIKVQEIRHGESIVSPRVSTRARSQMDLLATAKDEKKNEKERDFVHQNFQTLQRHTCSFVFSQVSSNHDAEREREKGAK